MSRRIIGNTVGTPISPAAIERKIKPVKTINGIAADGNGNVDIPAGINGKDGKDGKDGYTPVKGVDYYTEAEQEQLIAGIKADLEIVSDATGENILLTDSAEGSLRGLILYGKSTQDGTPTPENPVEIVSAGADGDIGVTVCGANLLNIQPVTTYDIDILATGNMLTVNNLSGNRYGNASFNTNLPPGTYTLAVDTIGGSDVESGNLIELRDSATNGVVAAIKKSTLSMTFTLGKAISARLIIFNGNALSGTNYTATGLRLCVGSTALPWEQYKGNTLTALTPNGLHEHDYIDFARGVRVQGSAERVLYGTENYSLATNSVFNNTQVRFWYDGGQKYNANSGSLCGAYCNCFVEVTPDQSYMGTHDGFCIDHKGSCISFSYKGLIDAMTSVDEWVAYVKGLYDAGTPIIIRYPLATPIETPLSADELAQYAELHTNYPTTTITNDEGVGMEVSYVADTKNYIDKKFTELAAAIVANA